MTQRLPPLLPEPRRIEPRTGHLRVSAQTPVVLAPGSDDGDLATARLLADGLAARATSRPPIESHARSADLGPRLELRRTGRSGDRYRIDASAEAIVLEGDGPAGLRYAAQTLLQLADAHGRIPACRIEDAPDFPLRGLMLDVSRGKVPTLTCLEELVDRCALLKLNVLMLYVEHPFRFRRHPEIGADASPLDAESLRRLDAYAAARHVQLVPSLQSLGHMEHVLELPRYAGLAESDARWSLAPVDPGSYALLEDLYDEYLPNFRSAYFNANCDEPWDLGYGRSKERAEEIGRGGVFLEHVRKVRDLAARHGRRTLVWADVVHTHPDRVPEIDRDLVLLDWWYEADHDYDRVKVFAENGLDFWVCPGTSSWNCLFPRMENALANITGYADAGRRHGAGGFLVTDWGDFGHYNLLGNSWLGFAWAGQQAWSGDAPAARFDRAFTRLFFGDASGEAARLFRRLGAIHDAGFTVPNASALQFLYFDDLDDARFLEATREGALARSQRRLEQVRAALADARPRFGDDGLSWEELVYAADASLLAVRKARAARSWMAWRRGRTKLTAPARRTLARRLRALANEQAALGRTLRRLWLRRSRPSNFELTRRRLDGSLRSLRRAARALERNRPPTPPPAGRGVDVGAAFRALAAVARGEP